MKQKIYIFDTTLRDGEQSPGAKLNTRQKTELALLLEKLGVDILEVGFPISSPGDFTSVEKISKIIKNCSVCGLTRAIKKDIDVCALALKKAKYPRIHTGIGASDVHIKYKFKSTREKVLETAVEAVKYAKKYVNDIEFYAEDAGRADIRYLAKMVEAVINAGATVVNIPDTTGYCFPQEFGGIIKYLKENVANIDKAVISVHCHNDLGMATANTLSGIAQGARQAEVTINGIGERAGNTALEEIVMSLYTRRDSMPFYTNIKTERIFQTSKTISQIMGIPIQPNKAIVGANAFAHSSGIHQDGILKKRENYEIIDPKTIGFSCSQIILTARSGRAALRHRLEAIGYRLNQKQLDEIYKKFLNLADVKKEVYDQDLHFLMNEKENLNENKIKLLEVKAISSNIKKPYAYVKLQIGKDIKEAKAYGDGPVNAGFKAIDKCVDNKFKLKEFTIQAVTEGSDALAKVSTAIEKNGQLFWGSGTNTDTIIAAINSYIDTLNNLS